MAARFVEAWQALDISNDDFIRTTEPRHHRAVQAFLQTIHDNGFIELGDVPGSRTASRARTTRRSPSSIDGKCPIHDRAAWSCSRRRTTSSS